MDGSKGTHILRTSSGLDDSVRHLHPDFLLFKDTVNLERKDFYDQHGPVCYVFVGCYGYLR